MIWRNVLETDNIVGIVIDGSITTQIAKTIGSTSIRHLSDTFASNPYLIDVDPRDFAMYEVSAVQLEVFSCVIWWYLSYPSLHTARGYNAEISIILTIVLNPCVSISSAITVCMTPCISWWWILIYILEMWCVSFTSMHILKSSYVGNTP